jgi:hypothetical protein
VDPEFVNNGAKPSREEIKATDAPFGRLLASTVVAMLNLEAQIRHKLSQQALARLPDLRQMKVLLIFVARTTSGHIGEE